MHPSAQFISRRDIDFLLHDVLNVESLTRRARFADHSRETFAAALDLSADLAAEYYRPHNKLSDSNEPRFENGRVRMIQEVGRAIRAFADAGLIAAGFDAELGGMQLPMTVAQACYAVFDAANVATAAYTMLTIGNANLLRVYGTGEQKRLYLGPLLEGRFLGTMCLSETQAGSSLADITTTAEPQPDGTYHITGSKMWISAGDHELAENIVHLVLARIKGAPAGARGISLFLVPKRRLRPDGTLAEDNNIALAGLNHKMGYRGTTNCVLNFGEGGPCIGTQVGERNRGLACMFHMMNEARIAIGRGATMLGYAGYLASLDYARTRRQGRRSSDKDPANPPVAIIEHADVRRMLLAQKAWVEGSLALILYCARQVDELATAPDDAARRRALLLLDILTPIAKAWPSQYCLAANDLAIQIHGGYGYTREFDVEQYYRDNRLNPIHEGTNGIQALDLLGRKAAMEEGAAFRALCEEIRATAAGALDHSMADLSEWGSDLLDAVDALEETTATLLAEPDPDRRLANAAVYLEAAGHTVIAWMWLMQALAAADLDEGDPFVAGKLQACRYFYAWELPRTAHWHDLLRSLDDTTLTMQDEWF
jgi:alkylation response protein AidB-like acyl-CoA dehydrogenase